jgi:hypothetical protein
LDPGSKNSALTSVADAEKPAFQKGFCNLYFADVAQNAPKTVISGA